MPNIDWKGRWRNEYGSRLTITDDSGGRLQGAFETSLPDSVFAGKEVPILGLHQGPCAQFAFIAPGDTPAICSFTGLIREGRLHTAWHLVSDQAVKPPRPGAPPDLVTLPWAHAVQTNSDTFTREREAIADSD
ncbi:avidin/streptavidin family protein [Nocardia sp. NBC_01503]|uniref:avidin/streptavidin family protein n=1 Tax=Nocardia sp. NBC_01503 TaxID=2975997 RepID=UPI002E7B0250|nr:avidin/streptavidin family protein [Nocardia sp. NBC_01503]WTL33371.1 avidin/streptavidin family protein [Nocardia sp. NBC_01503]